MGNYVENTSEMATGADQAVGYGMVGLAASIFAYYTVWILLLPFVDPEHAVQDFFPPRIYAVTVPIVAGVCVLIVLGIAVGVIMAKKKSKAKKN